MKLVFDHIKQTSYDNKNCNLEVEISDEEIIKLFQRAEMIKREKANRGGHEK